MSKLAITQVQCIITVELDNPPANVLTMDLIQEMNDFLGSLEGREDVTIIIFKSKNPLFFSAHLDLNLINGTPEGQEGCLQFSLMIKNIKQLKQLSIAIVDGVARGGGDEFVMACDLSYGTENATFAQPEIGVNIPTGGQGGVQYGRRMGRSKALQALLTGMDHTAQEAEKLNIITQYIPKSELDGVVTQLLSVLTNLELRDIVMYKEIIAASVLNENDGVELEMKYFLDRAKEDKSQSLFNVFLKHGGQTEREATDFPGIFADTMAELNNK